MLMTRIRGLGDQTQLVLRTFFLIFSLICVITGFASGDAISGLIAANTCTTRLTTDVLATGGMGGGMLNVGIVGLYSWALMKFTKSEVTGLSFGGYFLMVGVAFLGKTAISCIPIIIGTYIYSRLEKEDFGKNVNMAMYACALSPIFTDVAFNQDLGKVTILRIVIAFILAVIAGWLFPEVAKHTVAFHKGFNLFNAGLAAGLMAIGFDEIYRTFIYTPRGLEYKMYSVLSSDNKLFFNIWLGIICILCVIAGALIDGGFKGYLKLLKASAYKNDFTKTQSCGAILINFGITGICAIIYIDVVGAPFTGATICAVLNMLCWMANGSHIRNIIPVFVGYALVSVGAAWDLSSQSIIVGIMFATGLTPIVGEYGIVWGIVAGCLHSCLVPFTAAFHGGLNTYNGGFTAGLTAIILVPVMENYVKHFKNRQKA